MTRLSRALGAIRSLFTLTPEQAERLAETKFPCC